MQHVPLCDLLILRPLLVVLQIFSCTNLSIPLMGLH
uniref:Uncharacterized protein n=1 Tax=Anguilla anguilla TaxID=7936 RepID=A0A0E9SZ30_ANGAN